MVYQFYMKEFKIILQKIKRKGIKTDIYKIWEFIILLLLNHCKISTVSFQFFAYYSFPLNHITAQHN
jgi:hypothetical protein